MRILSVILLLTIAATALSVKKHHKKEGALYFYHKYEKNHSEALNPKIPLQKHYSNERNNRKEANKLEDEILTIKRDAGFKERTLKREKLALENKRNVVHSIYRGEERMDRQHERAIKEEINHQEKFREKYEHRLDKNRKKLVRALPDQVEAYKKLVDFDERRVKHFTEAEHKEQHELHKTVEHDLRNKAKISEQLSELDGKIAALKAKIQGEHANVELKTSMLHRKKHHIDNIITRDDTLDR